jgi:hypothetical protein
LAFLDEQQAEAAYQISQQFGFVIFIENKHVVFSKKRTWKTQENTIVFNVYHIIQQQKSSSYSERSKTIVSEQTQQTNLSIYISNRSNLSKQAWVRKKVNITFCVYITM